MKLPLLRSEDRPAGKDSSVKRNEEWKNCRAIAAVRHTFFFLNNCCEVLSTRNPPLKFLPLFAGRAEKSRNPLLKPNTRSWPGSVPTLYLLICYFNKEEQRIPVRSSRRHTKEKKQGLFKGKGLGEEWTEIGRDFQQKATRGKSGECPFLRFLPLVSLIAYLCSPLYKPSLWSICSFIVLCAPPTRVLGCQLSP